MKESINPKRILIVEVNWLGDVLFSTAAIRMIRRNFPDSFIACMVVPRVKEILEDNPNIGKLIVFDEDKSHKGLIGKLRFIFNLRKEHFDTVFLFHRSFTRLLLCFLSGIKTRIGYYTKKRGFLLTQRIIPPDMTSIHRGMYYVELLKRAGLTVEYSPRIIPNAPTFESGKKENVEDNVRRSLTIYSGDIRGSSKAEFFVSQDARDYVSKLLKDYDISQEEKFVVLNPGANWLPKRWPTDYFTKLTEHITKELNTKVIFSGSSCDSGLIDKIIDDTQSKPINFCGKTNLKQLAALFERASVVVSADSGPLHIANCVGAKVIALFGPTSVKITGPFGKGYYNVLHKDIGCIIPCYENNCLDNRCMKEIRVEEVFNKVKSLLSM